MYKHSHWGNECYEFNTKIAQHIYNIINYKTIRFHVIHFLLDYRCMTSLMKNPYYILYITGFMQIWKKPLYKQIASIWYFVRRTWGELPSHSQFSEISSGQPPPSWPWRHTDLFLESISPPWAFTSLLSSHRGGSHPHVSQKYPGSSTAFFRDLGFSPAFS